MKLKRNKAPLVQVDRNELGDKRLNVDEAVARAREEDLALAARSRIDNQDELEDQERSAGPRLAYTEVLQRIRKANINIHVLEGSPGAVALYAPRNRREVEQVILEGRSPKGEFFDDHKYVGGFVKEPMPEFSHVILDTSKLPIREIRGWRSVLIQLIKTGALTYRQAVEHFGEPIDRRGNLWFEQLADFRK